MHATEPAGQDLGNRRRPHGLAELPQFGSGARQTIPTSAPITAAQAGSSSVIAAGSVLRIVCQATSMSGTGFLHKSGRVITAAHVVAQCSPDQLRLLTPNGETVRVASVAVDEALDLGLLEPSAEIVGPSLTISARNSLPVGVRRYPVAAVLVETNRLLDFFRRAAVLLQALL